jgi:hypothetical protein
MADDDGPDPGEDNGHSLEFNAAAWSPDDRSYGLFYLMVIRQGLPPEKLTKPAEVENLKFVESRLLNHSVERSDRRHRKGEAHSDGESDDISEGEPYEETDAAPWPGKRSSWWRVHSSLGEVLVVREGLSLHSAELLRMSPGDAVQQAGTARMLKQGRCRGCIRLPVKPRGWVTADATRAGGPRYLVSSGAPRWRVVYSSPNSNEGDAIIRAEPALDSDEVAVLYHGDIVEQAGPSEKRGQGIVRMPVTAIISHRNGSEDQAPVKSAGASSKVLGWVTIDASSAGGPVFFKPTPEPDKNRRRRYKDKS